MKKLLTVLMTVMLIFTNGMVNTIRADEDPGQSTELKIDNEPSSCYEVGSEETHIDTYLVDTGVNEKILFIDYEPSTVVANEVSVHWSSDDVYVVDEIGRDVTSIMHETSAYAVPGVHSYVFNADSELRGKIVKLTVTDTDENEYWYLLEFRNRKDIEFIDGETVYIEKYSNVRFIVENSFDLDDDDHVDFYDAFTGDSFGDADDKIDCITLGAFDNHLVNVRFLDVTGEVEFTIGNESMTLVFCGLLNLDFDEDYTSGSIERQQLYYIPFDFEAVIEDASDIYLDFNNDKVTFVNTTSFGTCMSVADDMPTGTYTLNVNTADGIRTARLFVEIMPEAYDPVNGITMNAGGTEKHILVDDLEDYWVNDIYNNSDPTTSVMNELNWESDKIEAFVHIRGYLYISVGEDVPTGNYTIELVDYNESTLTLSLHVIGMPHYIQSVTQATNGNLQIGIDEYWIDTVAQGATIRINRSPYEYLAYLEDETYAPDVMYTIVNDEYIEIPFEAIKQVGLTAGSATLFIDTDDHREDFDFTLETGVSAVPTYDAYEDADGNLVIRSTDEDFINAIAHVYTSDVEADYTSIRRSSLIIKTAEYARYGFTNVQDIYQGDTIYRPELIVSNDDTYFYVSVSNSEILFQRVVNGEHTLIVNAYGYAKNEKSITITQGVNELTAGFTVEVTNDGDILIKSDDEDWLQGIAKYDYYNFVTDESEEGGNIYFHRLQSDYYRYIGNTDTVYNGGEQYHEISTWMKYVEGSNNEQSYVFVPKEVLTRIAIADGLYRLNIMSDGYADEYYETPEGFSLSGYLQEAPEYSVYQEEGTNNLVIESEDEDFIRAICFIENPDNWEYVDCASEFSYWDDYYENGFTNAYDEFTFEEGQGVYTATFNAESFINESTDGEHRFVIGAYGYETIDTTVYVSNALKDAPTECFANIDSNGNLVITMSDPDAISAFANDQMFECSIFMADADGNNYGKNFHSDSIQVVENRNQLVIDKNDIPAKIENCTLTFYISGYKVFQTSATLRTLKAAPSDLRVYQDTNGNLKITTKDSSFLRKLEKGEVVRDNGALSLEDNYIANESNDRIYNYKYYYGSKLIYSVNNISLSGSILTVDNGILVNKKWRNGEQTVTICVEGYRVISVDVNFSNLCIADPVDEEDFTIAYVEGTGVVITCDDEDYLEAMAVNANDDSSGSYIWLSYGSGGRGISNDSSEDLDYNYSITNNQIIIPDTVLTGCQVDVGELSVKLLAYGRTEEACYTGTVTIPNIYKELPDDIEVYIDINGNLVVESEDEDYLTALTKTMDYTTGIPGDAFGGKISIYSEEGRRSHFYNVIRTSWTQEILISQTNKVVLNGDNFRGNFEEDGTYDVWLYANGYEVHETTVELLHIKNEMGEYSVAAGETLQLTYDAEGTLVWSVDDEELATIDEDGLLTAMKAGTVEVSVNNGTIGDKTIIVIHPYTPEGRVTASLTGVGSIGFEAGDTALIQVKEAGEEADNCYYDFVSNNESVAIVDNLGNVTAVAKGSATITIQYGGTNSVAAKLKVTVIDRQINSIRLYSLDYTETAEGILLPGNVTNIQLSLSGKDKLDADIAVNKAAYVSSDTSVATVDKNGLVTIKKAGQFTITATTTTNAKTAGQKSDSIIIRVIDYTPVLETNKLNVNRYITSGSNLGIYARYDSDITAVSFVDEETPFTLDYDDETGIINVKFNGTDADKNKTYNEALLVEVTTEDEEVKYYQFAVKITLVSSLPSVTVKASGSYNTSTNENNLKFTATAKGAEINRIEFAENWASVNAAGNVTINGTQYKGKVNIYFTGYSRPVTKSVSFKTVSTLPKYSLSRSSITLFVPESEEGETRDIELYIKDASKNIVTEGSITAISEGITVSMEQNGKVILRVPATGKGGTYKLGYRKEGWTKDAGLSIKVSINKKIPTAKLAASTVALNTHFDRDTQTAITTSSGDLITSAVVAYAGKGNAPSGLSVTFDEETQTVKAACEGTTPVGTYKFSVKPVIKVDEEDYDLKAVTVNVKVNASVPTVTFKSTSAKVNKGLGMGHNEEISTSYTVKNNPYNIDATESYVEYRKVNGQYEQIEFEEDDTFIDGWFEDGVFSYIPISKSLGKEEIYIRFVYEDLDGESVYGDYIKFSLNFYNAEPKASISIKGNLNQLDLSTEVAGTIKFTNLIGYATDATLTGDYKDDFHVEVEEGKLIFTLTETGKALRDGTYKVNVNILTDTGATVSAVASIKLARKAPKLKLQASTVNVYDMTSIGEEVGRVKLEQTGNGTVKAFWSTASLAYELRLEGDYVVVYLKDAAAIKAGSTSKFTIKIDWVGDYGTYEERTKSLRTTSLTLNVKDCSYNVKGTSVTIE